jgi:hypothetical protein
MMHCSMERRFAAGADRDEKQGTGQQRARHAIVCAVFARHGVAAWPPGSAFGCEVFVREQQHHVWVNKFHAGSGDTRCGFKEHGSADTGCG